MAVLSANSRYYVPRPGPAHELQANGLFKAATGPLELPDKAIQGGLEFESPYCGLPDGYANACAPASKAASLVGGWTTVTGDPFWVLAGSECGFGTNASDDARTREVVLAKLYGGEQNRVEDIFSRGSVGQARGLANGGATALAASANIVVAFGLLESNFATTYGLPGMIHVPLIAEPITKASHLVEQGRDGVWYTPRGTKVVFGNYAGLAPGGGAPAAGHTNIYITAPVTVWRGEPIVSPWDASVNKTTNQILRFAERPYVVTYECAAYATDVDFTVCC
jgi:hypothetical protein